MSVNTDSIISFSLYQSFSPEWGFKNSSLNASAKLCTKALNISLIELSAPPLNSAISSQQDPVLTSKSAICEYVLNHAMRNINYLDLICVSTLEL